MKVLVVWPPHVPSYFNAGHHTPLYMTAGYLRAQPYVERVDVRDAGVLNTHWKAIGDLLYQGRYDVIAMMNDFDAVDGFERFTAYARELSPDSRLITFGRLSSMNPGFFQRYGLDAIVQSGDYEPGVAHYLASLAAGTPHTALPGVAVRHGERWVPPAREGDALPSAEWVLPDVREIPYEHYDRLYARDEDKFCGIPFRRELVVPAARGCPVGCEFCEVHEIFGLRERRLSVDATVAYIEESTRALPFEYVAFYAPTFTLDKRWVRELCNRFLAGPVSPRWKCATTVHHLDADLVELMGAAGCVRISVGLETLEPDGHGALPRTKRIHEERFRDLAEQCAKAGIELNAFVIVGLPGTGAEGARRTRTLVGEVGARFRPTMYTRLHDMKPTMTPLEVSRYNRHLIAEPGGADDDGLYEFLFGRETRVTSVYERIPSVADRSAE
ncbi:Radical SAM superfamily protein [Sinosporangium album]|uniref:Radical SAM superfamily protein n=1 Tax=Sinosporangium album TaxID=504805 RepID=A0A1G7QJR8_9ACTN|nr:radical SAM protein [Sinosporangium album]SDF98744.1 Radical SAM superfamily protein [Sinosporangium album]